MSILIRGMEVPTSCKECRLTYDSSWCLLLDEPNECVEGGLMWKRCAETGRLKDCPLVPVPPYGLIDREQILDSIEIELAMANAVNDMEDYDSWVRVFDYVRKFPKFPTIIPAEEGE